ncbi:MAG TPA: 3-deoxy-manno-octulosonate cytidylyltransferase [Woeseiaceae bacterium]|nr:3-deoxy-manno-octulosonate cytidylyltransferase [Woeseiaceae bacterium]
MNDFVVVIPARYASVRLPGKPLRLIAGKPMLQHVHERAAESRASEVIIATDDRRIAAAAEAFGAKVCMTAEHHQSGTDRLAEVSRRCGWPKHKAVVNLQGDEPLMPAGLINQCAGLLAAPEVGMATLASPFLSREEFDDPNVVKVILDTHGDALYFSRAAIPYARSPANASLAMGSALHHHGIYAYRVEVLQRVVAAERSPLEQAEQLEQLRALALGVKIRVGRPEQRPGPGVDTEADLARVAKKLGVEDD